MRLATTLHLSMEDFNHAENCSKDSVKITDFDEGLSAENYIAITKKSRATAT